MSSIRPSVSAFSAALCRGLIEASGPGGWIGSDRLFSAALCRGLIEASLQKGCQAGAGVGFPRLYAAASLKRAEVEAAVQVDPPFSAALCRGLIEA